MMLIEDLLNRQLILFFNVGTIFSLDCCFARTKHNFFKFLNDLFAMHFEPPRWSLSSNWLTNNLEMWPKCIANKI